MGGGIILCGAAALRRVDANNTTATTKANVAIPIPIRSARVRRRMFMSFFIKFAPYRFAKPLTVVVDA